MKIISQQRTGHDTDTAAPAAGVGSGPVSPWYNAKYSATQENRGLQPISLTGVDPLTGEILTFEQDDKGGYKTQKQPDPRTVRLERFALQSASRRLLWGSRTAKCLRLRRWDKSEIEVWRSADHGSAHYGGLQTCGSVWACPVCAAKISERRRVELLQTMEAHKAAGGQCLLLTLTHPHSHGDDLAAMLKAQAKALDSLNKNRAGRALWDSLGTVGTVRALEVTHGGNGWHPHFHILIFCGPDVDRVEARRRFYDLWSQACVKVGLGLPSDQHGVRLDGGDEASAYVTKGLWGLDHEMTKGHIKKASKGRSPFDLLRSYLYDDDKQAAALFREYAQAFKGKRQLQYSNGLKKLYQVEDLTDEQIAAVQDDEAELLGSIDLDQWRLILAADLRGEVLELARHGWEPVARLLSSLKPVTLRKKDKT